MSDRQWGDFIDDIIDAIEAIEEFIQGITYDEFVRDRKTNYAVIRSLEVIGEASKNIPDFIRANNSHIPWFRMKGSWREPGGSFSEPVGWAAIR